MIAYEVKSDKFSGPLSKLLELVEEKKLEVTAISLAEVTADFLKYFSNVEEEEKNKPRFLADFIAVASRLILIKSKALLPNLELTAEEEAEIKDLEERLKIYKEFALAKINIKTLWHGKARTFERRFLPPSLFLPPTNLTISDLHKAIAKLGETLQFTGETESAKISLLNFEEKLRELALRIKRELQSSFRKLTKDKDKEEIVILFLAILHLLKDNLISTSQKTQFADIVITAKKKNGK